MTQNDQNRSATVSPLNDDGADIDTTLNQDTPVKIAVNADPAQQGGTLVVPAVDAQDPNEPTIISLDELQQEEEAQYIAGNDTLNEDTPPERAGEQLAGGQQPDLEIDDDVHALAHSMGIGLDADEEHPKPLNIAEDVRKAEEEHRDN